MTKPLHKYGCLLLSGVGAWALNTLAAFRSAAFADGLSVAVLFLWATGVILLRRSGRWRAQSGTHAVLALGFVLGFIFVVQLHHLFSWHDLAGYSADFSGEGKPDGHLGYIAYLVEYGRLPLEDPRIEGYTVFYNPPLYHLLQAGFMKINLALGLPQAVALENLQVFTLVCAAACPMVTVDLMRFLGMKEAGVRTGAMIMAFQPMLLILGATLNTDALATLLGMLCILFTIRWLKTRSMRDILLSALVLGLGMATKISNALLIPVMAIAFAVAFFQDLKNRKRYAGQFTAFLCLSVPEAMAWPMFHLIAYQLPFSYVRLPAETINVERYTLWQRFGIPDGQVVRSLFYSGIRKVDHNVWMQTLKTSMFDELTLFELGTPMWYAAYLAMAVFAALALCTLILFIRFLVRKNDRLMPLCKVFLGGYAALLFVYYLKFCYDYPYICSFNFRYILMLMLPCAVALADYRTSACHSRWLSAAVGVFGCLTMFVYGVYFFS